MRDQQLRPVDQPDAGPHDKEPVENRPNVSTTTPDAYPKDGPDGGGKPDYGSPKR